MFLPLLFLFYEQWTSISLVKRIVVGFIIGVIQDSVETALNSSSDLLLSASAEFRQWRLDGREIKF